jgi:hypothetical protein
MARSPSIDNGVAVAAAPLAADSVVDRHDVTYTFWPPLVPPATMRAVVLVDSSVVPPADDMLTEMRADGFAVVWWNGEPSRPADAGRRLALSARAAALDTLTRVLLEDHRVALQDIVVVAQGADAMAALTWAHDYAPRVRAVVAASNRLLWESGSARAAEDDGDCASRIARDAAAIEVPLLLLLSDAEDDEVRRAGEAIGQAFAARPAVSTVVVGDAARPPARQTARGKLRDFLRNASHRPFSRASLLDAHKHGFTKDELDRFLTPLPRFSKRWFRLAFGKASIQTLGLLSTGMRIGLRTGFDSGSTMEYVYANVASGITSIGRKLDESFLASPGWIAIRVRRRNVQRLIADTARRIQEEGRELHVVDIAAGHGRYVMDALLELERRPDSLRLQEYVDANVDRGRELLDELGLADVGVFVRGDAFDGAALAAMRPRPSLAVTCGIYELCADNAVVIESLAGLSRAMEQGSYLVYTNQPWQPLLEFFVRAVPSHRDDRSYNVRRRTQAEMDQLVEHAGFTKISQATDPQGIFSVSVARKTAEAGRPRERGAR